MRILALLSSLALIGIGAVSYYGWEARGWEEPTLTSGIPGFVGGGMLLGTILSLALRKSGLQLAYLAALAGAGLGVGRLLPPHLEETLDPRDPFTALLLAMVGVCAAHVVLASLMFLFRKRPNRKTTKRPAPPKPNPEPVAKIEAAEGTEAPA
jgi:hypothetical protein